MTKTLKSKKDDIRSVLTILYASTLPINTSLLHVAHLSVHANTLIDYLQCDHYLQQSINTSIHVP